MTWWYALLNRIKFTSPTRGLIYRVRLCSCHPSNFKWWVAARFGLIKASSHRVRRILTFSTVTSTDLHSLVAVAYFYGSMSLLEGKVHEAIPRIQAVCLLLIEFPKLIQLSGIRSDNHSQLVCLATCSYCGLLTLIQGRLHPSATHQFFSRSSAASPSYCVWCRSFLEYASWCLLSIYLIDIGFYYPASSDTYLCAANAQHQKEVTN